MTSDPAALRRLDAVTWSLVAATAGLALMAVIFGGFSLALRSFVPPAATSLLLWIAARYYRDRRNDPKLAAALESTAQVIAFVAVAAPLSYVAASAALPLRDAAFDGMDRALGVDWRALAAALQRWPALHHGLRIIYLSLSVQMTAVVLLLGFTGRLSWLRVYMLAFLFAAFTTIAMSALLPAQGAWLHHGIMAANPEMLPVSSPSWPVFDGLRDGSIRTLMAVGAQGIITFPSLHAALAVILIAAFWPIPKVRWCGFTINALMLMATPVDGSHYIVDILAGIAIAVVCLMAARWLVMRMTRHPVSPNAVLAPASMPQMDARTG
jgi:hypothetical protein